jgi:DNA repair protein RecO (recombination protein O)
MKTTRTRAIVLRRTNYGEADRILQLLTPDGKKSVMAKGVRREKSRLAGGIELFALTDVVIGEGRGELGILTSARLVQFYRHIMEDYDRMQFAYAVIKWITKASEMVDEPEWYDVLAEVLMGLDVSSIELGLVETWFYLHYASLLGHELSLYHDTNGDTLEADQKYRYDEADQGVRPTPNGELTSEHIKLLRLIATRPLKTLAQIGGISDILPECLMVARQHAAI